MRRAHTADSEVEAVMLQGILQDAGIPVTLRPHTIPGYTLAVFPPGWADLLVPDERLSEAERLIAEYLASLDQSAS